MINPWQSIKEEVESSRAEIEEGPDTTIVSLCVKPPGRKSDVISGGICYLPPDQKPEGNFQIRKQIRQV